MWVELICGLVIYRLVRRFFYDDDSDHFSDFVSSDSTALFSVADRLEKLYGGKAFVGLRIPDADTGSRQNIDLVLLTKGEALVISVKNLSGFVSVDGDGSWVCTGSSTSKHKTQRLPDPELQRSWKELCSFGVERVREEVPSGLGCVCMSKEEDG